MSKKVKGLMQAEYRRRFEGLSELAVINTCGIDGVSTNELRRDLRAKGIQLVVVKNSLAKKAFAEVGLGDVGRFLEGPCTVAYGGESLVDVMRELKQWSKKLNAIEFKGGILEGQLLDTSALQQLADMPSKKELRMTIAAAFGSPARRLSAAVASPASSIAGCIKSLIEKLESGSVKAQA